MKRSTLLALYQHGWEYADKSILDTLRGHARSEMFLLARVATQYSGGRCHKWYPRKKAGRVTHSPLEMELMRAWTPRQRFVSPARLRTARLLAWSGNMRYLPSLESMYAAYGELRPRR